VDSIPDLMARMERAEINEIVQRAGDLVAEHYVFADVGARLRDLLTDRASDGAYGALVDPPALAGVVTEDLQSLNGDLHLRLRHHAVPLPEQWDEEAAHSTGSRRSTGSTATSCIS
jgi:hypothetical protein